MSGFDSTTSGAVGYETLDAGDSLTVISGGTATGCIVMSGGSLYAVSGGTIYDTSVSDASAKDSIGGFTEIYGGGAASGTQLYQGGNQDLDGGGNAYFTVIFAGGIQDVDSGTTYATTISSGGEQVVSGAGAYASDTVIKSAGLQDISSGGVDYGTQVDSGGDDLVEIGGSASGTTVNSGGTLIAAGDFSKGNFSETAGAVALSGTLVNGTQTTIYTSGATTFKTVSSGGTANVYYNGNLVETETQTGNELYTTNYTSSGAVTTSSVHPLDSGGVATDVTVASGGTVILDGGYLSDPILQNGATLEVGGTFTYAGDGATLTHNVTGIMISGLVSGGAREIVNSGNYSISQTFEAGAVLSVTSGAAADQDTISSGGTEVVLTGATDSATSVLPGADSIISGGFSVSASVGGGVTAATYSSPLNLDNFGVLDVYNDGDTSAARITAGGYEIVNSGGNAASSTLIDGNLLVLNSGVAFSTTIEAADDGPNYIHPSVTIEGSGGYAAFSLISNGGSEIAYEGGQSLYATVYNGGTDIANSGGVVYSAIIGSGGVAYAVSGGHATSNTVKSSGVMVVSSGGQALTNSVLSGGFQKVSSGGVSSATLVQSGGNETVFSGGVASDTTLSGGHQYISGGLASSTTIGSGGAVLAFSGGVTSATSVQSGGLEILSGGTSYKTTLAASGYAEVFSGGHANRLDITSGGSAFVYTAGTVSGADVEGVLVLSGGTSQASDVFGVEEVDSGGKTVSTTVDTGGAQQVLQGGVTSNTVVNGDAIENVHSGGAAYNTVVSGGTLYVETNATASGGSATADSHVYVYGTASASGFTLNAQSQLVVAADGTVSGIQDQGQLIVSGTALTSIIGGGLDNSGYEAVEDGAKSISASVLSGGVQEVFLGGVASNTHVSAGGEQRVDDGGSAVGTAVFSGGVLSSIDGNLTNAHVADGGVILDGKGDPATDTTVGSGGLLIVGDGGEATGTTVQSGGTLIEEPGAEVTDSNVQSGGSVIYGGVIVTSGGTVISAGAGTTSVSLTAGETEEVLSGGTAYATTIHAGAVMDIDGGTATGGIAFSGGGGELQIDSVAPATVISGVVAGDVIDLTGLVFSGNSTPSLSANDTLTVTEGGSSVSLNFDASVSGQHFTASADAAGGTEVALCYCAGTRIATPAGERLIEELGIGDRVSSMDGTAHPIKWIGRRSYEGRFIADNHLMAPIRIRAGALDNEVPARDLFVSPGHGIFIGGTLVPAWRLMNGVTITQEPVASVRYYHLELASHEILLAENCPAESFCDERLRGQFQNAQSYVDRYPGPEAPRVQRPRLESGFALREIQEQVAARAGLVPDILPAGPLRGFVDSAGPRIVTGWAQDLHAPEEAVCLDIIVNGQCIERVLANQYRADLRAAGVGSGCHAFEVTLAACAAGALDVRRAADGAKLPLTRAAASQAA